MLQVLSEIKTLAVGGHKIHVKTVRRGRQRGKGQRREGGERGKEGGGGGERRQFELFKVLALNFRG